MPDPEPSERVAPQVDVVHQFIVGFAGTALDKGLVVTQRNIETALATLLHALPATLVKPPFVAASDNQVFFALAVISLDNPDYTLADLRNEVESGNDHYAVITWVDQNAPIAMALLDDPLLRQQWALDKLGVTDLWTVTPAGGKTTVAIVDSGLRRPDGTVHADLDAGAVEPVAVCQTPNFFPDNIDMDGHGTLLAGTIAAVPDNAIGIASAVPVAWNISLLPVKFFSPDIEPNAADAASGIAHAATVLLDPLTGVNPVRVINASWHVAPGLNGLPTLRAAISLASSFGCLVVFAAGNDGTDNEVYPTYPASFGSEPAFAGKVLTVLASDRYDGKAFFSNYGENTVDLAAPGLRILSTNRYLVDPPRYSEYSGTSPAAAYGSAGAALVFALNPGWQPSDVVQHLKASADTIQDLKIACIGGKRLNLRRAVYGPLHIRAPAEGDTLKIGFPTNITWTNEYINPSFTQVKIEFSKDVGATWAPTPIAASANNNGLRPWTPIANQATLTARIRITPKQGNFPAVSDRFKVVV